MKFIIIAPHPDDELIGCFTLFKRGLVKEIIYINANKARVYHAKKFSKKQGVIARFLTFQDFYHNFVPTKKFIYLVPDIIEKHPLHKAVSNIIRVSNCKLGYYTTEMNTSYIRELSEDEQSEKRQMLNKYYPNQKLLWENDWKYFLFEGIVYDLLSQVDLSKKVSYNKINAKGNLSKN